LILILEKLLDLNQANPGREFTGFIYGNQTTGYSLTVPCFFDLGPLTLI